MQPRISHKALRACGILASLTYVATDIVASLRYPGYNFIDQTVSELFAIGAPTSRIVVPLFTLSSTLLVAFAFGVWASCGHNRALRWLSTMIFANAVNTVVLWNVFPLHMRGVAPTFTDTMHLVLAVNPFVLLSIVFGIVAFKGSFRVYSAVTVLVLVLPAVVSFSYVTAVAANLPTPGMGLAERVAQYGYQLWQAMLAVVLMREGRQMMFRPSAFKTTEGEAKFLAAYDREMKLWPVPYQELDVRSRFGTTHVVICGPKTAPPLVLLHGYMATLTMWWPNIAAFSKDYRVYAIDVMGQPSKSRPDEPIGSAADFVSWLSATLDALQLERVFLVGMSFGGWLALNHAVAAPQRVRKLVLLSPGGLLPMVRQFTLRGLIMVWFPTRLTVNSFFRWLGFTYRAYTNLLDMVCLGLKHFRMPIETARVMPAVVSDEALRAMRVPTLLLIGDQEVISDPARALERAHRLIPDFEGELVPGCRHDMCATRHDIVDARVLEFLKKAPVDDRAATARRSVA
jgi:pimeloyl-ACP methyl ester carboxylesterase